MTTNNGVKEEDEDKLDLSLSDEEASAIGFTSEAEEEEEEEATGSEDKSKKKEEEAIEEVIDLEHEEEEEDEDKEVQLATASARLFEEYGLLDSAEGIKSFDDIKNKLELKKDNVIEEYLEGLPAELAEQLRAFERGVNPAEVRDALSTVASLKSLKDEAIKADASTAEKLYRELLQLEGNDDEYIDEMVQLAKDSDMLGKQGIRARTRILKTHEQELLKREEQAKSKAAQDKQLQDMWANNLSSAIDSDNGVWDMKLSNKDKKEVKSILFDAIETREIGGQKIAVTKIQKMIEEDPTVLVQIALGIQKGMFGKDGKLVFAVNKAKKSVMEELERAVNTKGRNKDASSSGISSSAKASYEKSIQSLTSAFNGLKI